MTKTLNCGRSFNSLKTVNNFIYLKGIALGRRDYSKRAEVAKTGSS